MSLLEKLLLLRRVHSANHKIVFGTRKTLKTSCLSQEFRVKKLLK